MALTNTEEMIVIAQAIAEVAADLERDGKLSAPHPGIDGVRRIVADANAGRRLDPNQPPLPPRAVRLPPLVA